MVFPTFGSTLFWVLRGCASGKTTNRDYAHSLALWLNYLLSRDCRWQDATGDDAGGIRVLAADRPGESGAVSPSTLAKDIAACKKFYAWAAGHYRGVNDIFADVDFPRAKREASVKWLDPEAVVRWRDVGVRAGTSRGGGTDRGGVEMSSATACLSMACTARVCV